MSPRLRAVICDFDGVIADTEPFHLRAFQEVLSGEGIVLTERDYYEKYLGMDDHDCFSAVLELHGRGRGAGKIASLIRKKSRLYTAAVMKGLVFVPGAVSFVKKASQRYPLAIASGALRREIMLILRIGGIDKAFRVIVSAEDIRNGKPDPEGFRTALKRLNRDRKARPAGKPPISPGECLVVEDSPFGVVAAKRAGMRCLAVETSYPKRELKGADAVKGSLSGVSLASLEGLFQRTPAIL